MFDDIHWAEATFLDLIEDLVVKSRDVPMLVVCMARGELLELRPGWGAEIEDAGTLALDPLASADSERLIGNFLGVAELGEEAQRIASTAEGNPLFLQEILRMLVDDGLLQRRGGRWRAVGELSAVAIPPTIRALLAARLDRLSHEQRLVLERAAIVGLEFWPGAVAELLPEEIRSEMDSHLEALAAKELIRPGGTSFAGEDALRFAHLLIRDAAYEQMLKETRAELHERFVAWLERRAEARAVEYEEIIGYHLEQAYRYREELGPVGDEDVDPRAAGGAAAGRRRPAGAGARRHAGCGQPARARGLASAERRPGAPGPAAEARHRAGRERRAGPRGRAPQRANPGRAPGPALPELPRRRRQAAGLRPRRHGVPRPDRAQTVERRSARMGRRGLAHPREPWSRSTIDGS